ncbi:MAG: ABC transporter permease [Deltaproteobacteria bacterium]|nr:ABC transporter permease [Deltaproteobacteria bacterium]
MLWHLLKEALRSLRRDAWLTMLMIGGLGFGVGVFLTATTCRVLQERDPLPGADALFHVEIAQGDYFAAFGARGSSWVYANYPNVAHSYGHAADLLRLDGAPALAATFAATGAVRTERGSEEARVQFATAALFPFFRKRLIEGRAWSSEEEHLEVAVLDAPVADRLFPGRSAIGESVTIAGKTLRVIGIQDYDPAAVHTWDFSWLPAPAIYVPLATFPALRLRPLFLFGRGGGSRSFEGFERSQDTFVHVWADLPAPRAQAAFQSQLDRYAASAIPRGRDPRYPQVTLRPHPAWHRAIAGVHMGFILFEVIGAMSLLGSTMTLMRLLMAKFQARAQETAIRRSLGATRSRVLLGHLLEACLVGLSGGLLGCLLATAALLALNLLMPHLPVRFALDATSAPLGIGAALLAGLIAASYPAWQVGRVPPATVMRRAG